MAGEDCYRQRFLIACERIKRECPFRTDRLVPDIQAPFAIQPGKKRVSIKKLQQVRMRRTCHRPPASASKEAVLIGEVSHTPHLEQAMDAGHALLPGIVEEMVEDVFGQLGITADLNDFADSAGLRVVDIPASDFSVVVME